MGGPREACDAASAARRKAAHSSGKKGHKQASCFKSASRTASSAGKYRTAAARLDNGRVTSSAATVFAPSPFPGAHPPQPLHVSHTAPHCHTLQRTLGHSTACIHTRDTHRTLPCNVQLKCRLVRCTSLPSAPANAAATPSAPSTFPGAHPPTHANTSTSVTQLHAATAGHTHSDTARHTHSHATPPRAHTHTPPHDTYTSSPDSLGAPACPAHPPMLLPPRQPDHCLVPTHNAQPLHVSHTASHCHSRPRIPGHSTACIHTHTRHTPHAAMPRTA